MKNQSAINEKTNALHRMLYVEKTVPWCLYLAVASYRTISDP